MRFIDSWSMSMKTSFQCNAQVQVYLLFKSEFFFLEIFDSHNLCGECDTKWISFKHIL